MKNTTTLRTTETEARYAEHKKTDAFKDGCALCKDKSIKEFKYWRIIPNTFPYDRIASMHNMLVPFRHVAEDELTDEEKAELREIKRSELNDYNLIAEATPRHKSLPGHFHLHLIAIKSFEQ